MSVGATPSLNFIGDTVGDVAPHAMSEMRGILFATGNSPTTGPISLSDFRNQVLTKGTALTQQTKILASDGQAQDNFGYSVAISGDGTTAIVAALYEDTNATNAGTAYIFTGSGASWSQQAKIQASDAQQDDLFGTSVAISSDGNTAIVGAWFEDTGSGTAGAAYIFTRSGATWTERAKIQASNLGFQDQFGASVAISGDGNTAIVGAINEDTGASNAGSAYIFTWSGTSWSEQARIQPSVVLSFDRFGGSVATSSNGNIAVVGARGNNGAAYIFTRSGTSWSQRAKIQPLDLEASDQFGWSIAISGDGTTVIVGANAEDTGGSSAGAAYIFTGSGASWSEQAKIQASDKQASDQFGYSVAISSDGNTAIVGSRYESTGGYATGAAYIFTRSGTTWSQITKMQASNTLSGDQVGTSVSISSDGTTAITGASGEDTLGTNAGAAYILSPGYYI